MKKINIPLKVYKEVEEYCLYNDIKDIEKEILSFIKKGFNLTKYGTSPFVSLNEMNKKIEEEVVEVPIIKKNEKNINKGIKVIKKD